MKKHLVTNDLISSVNWCLKAPPTFVDKQKGEGITWREKAFLDLKEKLSRVYKDMPIAAQRGIDFENKVYECILKNDYEKGTEQFKTVVRRVRNHKFDEKAKLTETISGLECFLYGKIDAYKFNDMIDIKTTQNFKEESYRNSFQHRIYCHCKQEKNFTYIVVEWLDYPHIKKVHNVGIEIPDLNLLKLELHAEIEKVFNTLKELDLWEVYRDKYCLY
jgi:hypothetical protein